MYRNCPEEPNIESVLSTGYPQEPKTTPMFSGDLYETVEVSDEEMAEIMQRRYAKC